MLRAPTSPCIIGSHDHPVIAGAFEVAMEPRRRRRRELEPDPGDTVRLPVQERSIQLWPVARA